MIELSNILSQTEDRHLEAKSAKGGFPDSFWETYSAFANTDGGTILLGVEEKSDLKFFSLIRFGERAGSGLSGIMHVWSHVYHTEATIGEKESDVDRTILTLPFNGHDQDVNAMLQLYDNYNEMVSDNVAAADLSGKRDDKVLLSGKITDKLLLSGKENGGLPITDAFIDKITDIYMFISAHPHSSSEDIASFTEKSKESAKKYLQALVAIDMLTPEGGNKNRTYSIKDYSARS